MTSVRSCHGNVHFPTLNGLSGPRRSARFNAAFTDDRQGARASGHRSTAFSMTHFRPEITRSRERPVCCQVTLDLSSRNSVSSSASGNPASDKVTCASFAPASKGTHFKMYTFGFM